ncbi:protein FRIGIDA-like [Rhododendron vialii]|uniref:protein FRIGIDA-like n=1 Tax=Rhododendron vialii TaxID=182163 RepID=UPI00265E0A30|nr:protein FRIGIDA-like [Rhododendron vialii]
MATPSPPPPVKPDLRPAPPPPQPSQPSPTVEQEHQHHLPIAPNLPTQTPSQPQQQQQQKLPDFINYIADLRNLSPALSAFHRRYDELHEHLDFIRTSIDSQLLQLLDTEVLPNVEILPPADQSVLAPIVEELGKSEEQQSQDDVTPESSQSEIETICKTMCFRSLRKYIISNLSNLAKLREEVPLALKLASNPAKLVLDCFGRFFLQGIKAYYKDSPMIPSRKASVLVLEYFLLMGFDSGEIEDAVKQEAESSAVDWKKRLMTEGGLVKACETDARGLLLLIGCFGIPKVFKYEDIWDLIRAGNVIEISDVLRRSNVLLTKIPDIIEWMVKNKMEVEAVDVMYTFGMESRFLPVKILKSFLLEGKQTWKKTKQASEGSVSIVNNGNKRQLADMKLVLKCLKDHKMDPSKVLNGWHLEEKISKLEKKISELDKKIKEQVKSKRKEADEAGPSHKAKSQDLKRARVADSRPHVDYIERNLLDGGIPQFSNTYSAYSSLAGPKAGIRVAEVLTPGSYATAFHGGIPVDRVGQISNYSSVQPYGWRGEASLNERLVSRSYVEPSAHGANGLYGAAATVAESYAGLSNPSSIGASYRTSTSDLYQFADTIVDRETYGGSRTGASATIPPLPIASAHHPTYYY